MIKIIQYHKNCIGCGSCATVCPKFWEMNYEEGKAFPKGAKKNKKGEYELKIQDIKCNQDAASACPVQVIKVIE